MGKRVNRQPMKLWEKYKLNHCGNCKHVGEDSVSKKILWCFKKEQPVNENDYCDSYRNYEDDLI